LTDVHGHVVRELVDTAVTSSVRRG
jgi:hypothetical protein